MDILGDYHSHTLYSHGKGTIEANVVSAINKGLKEVAITDHGFRHSTYNVRRSDFDYQMKEVSELRKKYPQINILLGLETNIQGNNGRIDISKSDIEKLDIIICGYHRFVIPPNPKQCFAFWIPNMINSFVKRTSRRRRVKNTDAFLRALNEYPIDIISHPMHDMDLDIVEVAKEAKRLGTYLELNGKKISMSDDDILKAFETGVEWIANSDAHHPDKIKNIDVPAAYVERLHLPTEQIVNISRLPEFRSHKLKNSQRHKTP